MTTLAEHIIVAGAENHLLMLEKTMYDSWASHIRLFSKGETLYEYYWRFSQLINDMHTIGMTMQQVQVNTKHLNALPPKWSKFVSNMKLANSLYTTNYDQLYTYLSQHKRHANEGGDLIHCINKALSFMSTVALRNRGIATNSKETNVAGQPQEKLLLVEAQEAGQILDEEQLSLLAYPGIEEVQATQQTIP
nr:hypothetical protein [Tanacetum cinerariifolium]